METWVQLLTNFGPLIVILFAIGYGSWRVLGWVGRELVLPARDHLLVRVDKFCDRVEGTLEVLAKSVERMSAK